ncbi:MAG: histidine kinase, partial [Bacteroidia bacterium]|nr:histidine kinase [Bacteroidia bacterium]
ATNEGIFYFDYYTYEKIGCPQAKSSSVFNLVISRQGIIYCHNLNNQIFKIRDKKCTLLYELRADEVKSDITLSISDNDHLVIGAGKVIVLNEAGTVLTRYDVQKHYLGPAFRKPDGAIQFYLNATDSVLVYEKGVFTKYRLLLTPSRLKNEAILKFFTIGSGSYALDLKSKSLYSYRPDEYILMPLPDNGLFDRGGTIRIYETGEEIWVAGTMPGTVSVTSEQIKTGTRSFYENYFISDVYRDREGNYLLSTFDKGVLVISDLNIPDVIHPFNDDPVTSLYDDDKAGLMMGSSKGKLWRYDNNGLRTVNKNGIRPIEVLHGSELSPFILFDDGYIRAYDNRTSKIIDLFEAPLKDVAFVSEKEFFLGINTGVVRIIWDGSKFNRQPVNGVSHRVYSMVYDTEHKALYASTANGLYIISADGKNEKITYKDKDIFSEKLYYTDGTVMAVNKLYGILLIEKNKVLGAIEPMVNANPEYLKKIAVYNQTIIASSSKGLYQFSMDGRLLKPIHSLFGFTHKKVVNFTVHNNTLWVSHSGGVQKIDLAYNKSNKENPSIRFDHILVNEQPADPSTPGNFESSQRRIRFIFSSPTLKNREMVTYHYQLLGYDTGWQISPYELNRITYNALAPGEYTLQVKAENNGLYSAVTSYPFTIALPFYASAWFIVMVVVLFLLLVLAVYRWQLNIQNRKSKQINELNASRLTAIQSQMNPHFIFNSLNSIQDLILKGDVEHSYSYIATFSDLVRRTLNYSEKDFIDFEQEIKLLELYLSLEKLRFKKDFTYTIELPAEEDFLVPPMLIQPFIENALVHGLLHKQGEKKLKVSFELKDNLICTIEDNGIGRERARAIQMRQKKEHESFSGNALHNRFEILNNLFKGKFGYTYDDLYQNDEPCGTKVTLVIPVKHEF